MNPGKIKEWLPPSPKEEALSEPDWEPLDLLTLPSTIKLGTLGTKVGFQKALGKEGVDILKDIGEALSDILSRKYKKARFNIGSKILGEEEMIRYITNKNIDEMLDIAFKGGKK